MNEERAHLLINYLGELTKLRSEGFACTDEINRCLAMIESEFANVEALSDKVNAVNELRDTQGQDGNWDYSDYMTGLFNGLELASATLENREPAYRPCNPDADNIYEAHTKDGVFKKAVTDVE